MGDCRIFVVRVWRQLAEFRASVRSADDAPPRLFTRPEQVGEFLRDAAPAAAGTGDTAPAALPRSAS